MCGIAGIRDPRMPGGLGETVRAMAAALSHRGPDAEGVWEDPGAGVALSHRRLSILDLGPGGAQPMALPGRGALSFNGEIYNHHEVRSELAAAGWRFASRSDTEVLLAACLAWGVERTLPRLRGMFAFAFWDAQEGALWLARDRMGEKPLYWGGIGGAVAFASELRALRRVPGWRGGIDADALAEYLEVGCVPAPRSIHPGISKLPPGSWLRIGADGRIRGPCAWWSVAEVAAAGIREPFAGSDEDADREMDRLLDAAVRGQMEADVPLGAFLSGGIDSSTVVAAMQRASGRPVRTFTIAFGDAAFDESRHARAVAAALGTEHEELRVSEADALGAVPGLPLIWDEPFADSSQVPTALVCRLARRRVTVALSGDGGDELFAGYVRHLRGPGLWTRLRRIPRALRLPLACAVRASPGLAAAAARFAGCREVHMGRKMAVLARSMQAVDEASFYRSLTGIWRGPPPLPAGAPRLDLEGASRLPGLRSRLQLWDQQGYLPDDILAKVDRAAMAVGLETRIPLLDERLVAFSWRLGDRRKADAGRGKLPLRRLASRLLPGIDFDRPKQGFAVPVSAWLRGPLRDWAEAQFASDRLARLPGLDPAGVRRSWRRTLAGGGEPEGAWAIAMLLAWMEAWKE